MKTKIYKFDPVVYPFPLLVCKYIPGVTAEEIAERFLYVEDRNTLQKISPEDLRGNPTTTAKTTCVVESESQEMFYMVILYRPKCIGCGIVAHEALHVVTLLCEFLGIQAPTARQDEPHAYLLQWVANCIWSVLKGKPSTMNGNPLNLE